MRFRFTHDKGGKRLAARDQHVPQLRSLRHDLTTLSQERFFERVEEERMRYRYQPYTVNKHRNQNVGLIFWYRQFIPRLFDLFREDSEKYRGLEVSVITAYRGTLSYAHPSA